MMIKEDKWLKQNTGYMYNKATNPVLKRGL